jgi:hypothetical protein
MLKVILIALSVILGLIALYAYVKHLFDEGYEEDEIYLHLFRDVPLRYLRRNRKAYTDYAEQAGYKKRPKEYETVDPDSYPSAYCWNCDPEVVALMNAAPVDRKHENQLLSAGGWKCACGKVNASYVSSCACGRSKSGDLPAEPAPVVPEEPTEDTEVRNAQAIREYKKLLDEGIITAEEFEAKKKQLLGL